MAGRTKRALVLTGAGASLEFGAPSTGAVTQALETAILADSWMQASGGDRAFTEIKTTLAGYFQGGASAVNFEHIYHCAHELMFTFDPTPRAVNEYRPILLPFLKRTLSADERALRALAGTMAELIFDGVSTACDAPSISLDPFAAFIANLREEHVTRIYTTNYDDFALQAAPDLYTGFDRAPSANPKRFDGRAFWAATDEDAIFHVHGSVHLGFPHPASRDVDIGELQWFDDRAEARRHATFAGGDTSRMDGSSVARTSVITGLDKLSRLQARPLSHFYAAMGPEAHKADIIYVIGSSLGDLHLNTWLSEARRSAAAPPIVFVDWWPDAFVENSSFEQTPKTRAMWHGLRMHLGTDRGDETLYGTGWTLAADRSCAVWDKGFSAFLATPQELAHVVSQLR